ncbi:hypothetical protein [Sulfurimonas sp.]|uniref:hypothetical protein n=1 Tax=Sulfurimonas sp. TaxID=2022749 RepID=UPI0026028F24|nr:hypothetical protein [Sulfurimonas sp.]MCW8895118.1 hypothetical protein [Sulfurimonas sp.]MCW9067093.1 hypothetical protein [Sulfurimonas sp.]
MGGFIDGVMIILFVLFMIFIFGGYHKNKSAAREAENDMNKKKSTEQNKDK